jgi:hypothetical protein
MPSSQSDRWSTVTIEVSYEDALRLWVLVHDPANAGEHRADERLRKLVDDAVKVTEDGIVESQRGGCD